MYSQFHDLYSSYVPCLIPSRTLDSGIVNMLVKFNELHNAS
jgi:hypothetical protein